MRVAIDRESRGDTDTDEKTGFSKNRRFIVSDDFRHSKSQRDITIHTLLLSFGRENILNTSRHVDPIDLRLAGCCGHDAEHTRVTNNFFSRLASTKYSPCRTDANANFGNTKKPISRSLSTHPDRKKRRNTVN